MFFTTNKKQLQHIACKLGVGQVSPAHHEREKRRGRARVKGKSKRPDLTSSKGGQRETDRKEEKRQSTCKKVRGRESKGDGQCENP